MLMAVSVLLDLTALDERRLQDCYVDCYRCIIADGEQVQLRVRSVGFVQTLFRWFWQLPFELYDASCDEHGNWQFSIEKRREAPQERLLVISRYRCPGHVAEIMMNLRLLRAGERMRLVVVGAGFDGVALVDQIRRRGFGAESLLVVGRSFTSVVVCHHSSQRISA